MWQSKRQCLLDTLKRRYWRLRSLFPLGVAYQYKILIFKFSGTGLLYSVETNSARQSKTIQHIYCHPEQIIPHTIGCRL